MGTEHGRSASSPRLDPGHSRRRGAPIATGNLGEEHCSYFRRGRKPTLHRQGKEGKKNVLLYKVVTGLSGR